MRCKTTRVPIKQSYYCGICCFVLCQNSRDVRFLQHDTVQFRCQTREILVNGVNLPQGVAIIKESHCFQQILLIGTIPISFCLYL